MMEEALDMFIRSKDLQEGNGRTSYLPATYINIGGAHLELGHIDQGKESYLKGLKWAMDLEQPASEGMALSGLGRYYLKVDSLDLALDHAQRSLDIQQKIKFSSGESEAVLTMAEIYSIRGNHRQAIKYGEQAYQLGAEKKNNDVVMDAAKILSESYSQLGEYKKSLTHLKRYQALQDSLVGAEKIRDASKMAAEYEFQKEQERLALEQQRKDDLAQASYDRQVLLRNIFFAGLALMVIIVIGVVLAYRRIRQINARLSQQSEKISYLNQNLERLVDERTEELNHKNAQLADYVFTNSHRVRGPIARILGLLQLREAGQFSGNEEKEELFGFIHRAASEADAVVFEISAKLEEE